MPDRNVGRPHLPQNRSRWSWMCLQTESPCVFGASREDYRCIAGTIGKGAMRAERRRRTAEKIIANTYRRNQFFGTHSHQRTLLHVALAWRYHCEILKCCRIGDIAGAVDWLKTHIARSERDALLPLSRM